MGDTSVVWDGAMRRGFGGGVKREREGEYAGKSPNQKEEGGKMLDWKVSEIELRRRMLGYLWLVGCGCIVGIKCVCNLMNGVVLQTQMDCG